MSLAIGQMNNEAYNKPILAIETSAMVCGASVYYGRSKFSDFNINVKNIHSEKLLDLVDESLSAFNLEVKDLSGIAVSMGPGSFTGLRIGLAAAKGLALGADLPLIPVPTFYAVARLVSGFLTTNVEFVLLRKVNVKELYGEIYRSNDSGFEIIREMEILAKEDVKEFTGNRLVFSDDRHDFIYKPFPQLFASQIASYATLYFDEYKITDFDFLEPNYFKKFIPRVNK